MAKKNRFERVHVENLLRNKREKPDTQCLRVRKKLHISQAEMAKLLNVHEDTVRRYEVGNSTPNDKTQLALDRIENTKRRWVTIDATGMTMEIGGQVVLMEHVYEAMTEHFGFDVKAALRRIDQQ